MSKDHPSPPSSRPLHQKIRLPASLSSALLVLIVTGLFHELSDFRRELLLTADGGKESRRPCGAPSADSYTAGQARVLGPSGAVHSGAGRRGRRKPEPRAPLRRPSPFPRVLSARPAPGSAERRRGTGAPRGPRRAGVGTGGAPLRPGGGDPAGPRSAAPLPRFPSSTARGSAAPPRPSGRDVTRRVLRTWSPRSRPAYVVPRAGAGWRLGQGERGILGRASAPPPRVGSPVDMVPRLAVAMLPYVAVTVAQCRFFLMSSGKSRHWASDVSTPSGIPAPVKGPPRSLCHMRLVGLRPFCTCRRDGKSAIRACELRRLGHQGSRPGAHAQTSRDRSAPGLWPTRGQEHLHLL
ncbi:uncharacterized protein LOC118918953 [Manis pentadactyla]|uniref:uncharacterized protein LOC118918953 n=1 Tax=Manis pentadactyla TaxID=143292 RepID=UPI00255CB53A|nr:uncharacterized protein LOC118918953 [Manis pentadactyla]